jgi:hypothetical protein
VYSPPVPAQRAPWICQVGSVFLLLRNSELIQAIGRFIDGWNERCQPFAWTKDTEAIIAKSHRRSTFGTRH